MSDRISWITHRGQKIIRVDYRGLRGEEFLPILEQMPALYKGLSKGSVLSLTDVRGAYATHAVMDGFKKLSKAVHEYDKKSAVLGIVGVKKVLLGAFNFLTDHSAMAFDDEHEALDWLVS